ncbi:hypothetical protein HDU87_006115 [Geranomyces variabilis]|uniref:Uncharacterized protein n=1 Tax=Geranomyces variabilis TaxID=109894 RepID=A0AAD5TG51_9FUNG|nr:hypothetical protein HDU87_006115 [Geranomyces variabilis]
MFDLAIVQMLYAGVRHRSFEADSPAYGFVFGSVIRMLAESRARRGPRKAATSPARPARIAERETLPEDQISSALLNIALPRSTR